MVTPRSATGLSNARQVASDQSAVTDIALPSAAAIDHPLAEVPPSDPPADAAAADNALSSVASPPHPLSELPPEGVPPEPITFEEDLPSSATANAASNQTPPNGPPADVESAEVTLPSAATAKDPLGELQPTEVLEDASSAQVTLPSYALADHPFSEVPPVHEPPEPASGAGGHSSTAWTGHPLGEAPGIESAPNVLPTHVTLPPAAANQPLGDGAGGFTSANVTLPWAATTEHPWSELHPSAASEHVAANVHLPITGAEGDVISLADMLSDLVDNNVTLPGAAVGNHPLGEVPPSAAPAHPSSAGVGLPSTALTHLPLDNFPQTDLPPEIDTPVS